MTGLFVCHFWQWPSWSSACIVSDFVCSYLTDESNLGPELSVTNRTRYARERLICRWCLALVLRCSHFRSASPSPFVSKSTAPFLIRTRHFARSSANCFQDSGGMLKSLREALKVSLYCLFWPPWMRFPACSCHKGFSLATCYRYQAFD